MKSKTKVRRGYLTSHPQTMLRMTNTQTRLNKKLVRRNNIHQYHTARPTSDTSGRLHPSPQRAHLENSSSQSTFLLFNYCLSSFLLINLSFLQFLSRHTFACTLFTKCLFSHSLYISNSPSLTSSLRVFVLLFVEG